ncbi:MAG: FHA domain-containing protein [Coriobacteriales bacterium]|jgi:pSer/pThr/pTyr-binding forkhead associated (FHA) protein|nr:FHA domain-containing protein [Coriobacteriales bacterium]
MDETKTCPVCGAAVRDGEHECERCGFKLVGATEELESPGAASSGIIEIDPCGKPRLTLVKGPLKGEAFLLDALPATIGRDPSCDIFLNNMTVSRKHAIIERLGSRIVVRDNTSLNGTWVDGKIVEEAELIEGTLLQVGTFSMRFSCR